MKKTSRQFECRIQIRHGLLYDVIDTNDELISGREFPELLSQRRAIFADWRFSVTPALGIVSPRTGETLWIPRQVWFSPGFANHVMPLLRPSFEEWEAGSYVRTLSSAQLHQALRSMALFLSGKWHLQGPNDEDHHCSHDDCPQGCGSVELTPPEELAEVVHLAKYRGIPRCAA